MLSYVCVNAYTKDKFVHIAKYVLQLNMCVLYDYIIYIYIYVCVYIYNIYFIYICIYIYIYIYICIHNYSFFWLLVNQCTCIW